MFYYLIIFIFISTLSLLELLNVNFKAQKFSSLLIVSLFVITAGFKYETGVDWYAYSNLFNNTPAIDNIRNDFLRNEIFSTIDYGYAILMSVIKFLSGSIQLVFFVMSFFTSLLIFKGLKIYTELKASSLLIYFSVIFFILDMSGIRQGLALAIFFYSVQYIYQKKIIKYLLLTLIAASFHWSAYFLIPVYFIVNKRYSSISIVVFFVVSISVFIFNIHWLEKIILSLFPSIENAILSARLLAYTTNNYAVGRAFNRGTIISVFFYMSTSAFSLYFRKNLDYKFKYFNLFLNIYLCQIFTFFVMFEFVEMADRLRLYFSISTLILLPFFIKIFRSKSDRLFIYIYMFVFTFFSCQAWVLSSPMTIAYSPYQNYIIYKVLGLKSTGNKRLYEQSQLHE